MSSASWREKFQKKLREKEAQKQEAVKKFNVYRDAVNQLFDYLESKVSEIDEISTSRKLVAQTSQGVPGPDEMVKTLLLKCKGKFIEFNPEGINLDHSRGRVRVRHNSTMNLSQYIYLHLVLDRNSEKIYPENLIWVYNDAGEENDFESLPSFDEQRVELLIEKCFLE